MTEAAPRLRNLIKDEDSTLALRAAESLGKMDDKSGLRLVTRMLRSDGPISRPAARALGVILGQSFRPNAEGVAAARRYVAAKGIK